MDWYETIVLWEGLGFVGAVFSFVGTYFAMRASSNAKSATEAAKLAVNNISAIDGIAELGQMLNRCRELRFRLEADDLHRVSEGCSDILQAVAKLNSAKSINMSEGGIKELGAIKAQIASLAKMIDRKLHENGQLDLVKIKTMLNNVDSSLAVLQVELKEKVATNE